MNHCMYKLTPPRPTFDADMTPDEASVMEQHFAYWHDLIERRLVIAYGPVLDPAGTFGIAIVEADRDAVHAIGVADPAVAAGVGTFEVFDMPSTFVRT